MRNFVAVVVGSGILALAGCGPKEVPEPPKPESLDNLFPVGWQYETKTDEMTGKVNYTTCLKSENTILLMPSGEEAHAQLCLRDNASHGKDAMIYIPLGGHIACSGGCTVRVRFNEDPPQTLPGEQPVGVANMAIFAGAEASGTVRQGVARSAKTRIEVELYGQGNKVYTFKTAGLDVSKIPSL